jgi:signal recognition particle GTPase
MRKKQERFKRRLLKNEFGFDFLTNSASKKMGNMKDLVGMIPGI